jgi:rSAM/selenodomain-associated transferase 2
MISIIIPALNEARALPATLTALSLQVGEFETIVVDGGSEDGTISVAESFQNVRVLRSARGRAEQMNAGAAVAQGEILLFLHADTLLPAGAMAELNQLEGDGECHAGGFYHRFSGTHWTLRVVSWLHNRRCELTGIFYGDQAMFVRRSLFDELAGFPAGNLEDIILSERIRARCTPRLLKTRVITDSRKFEQMGPVRSFMRCLLILASYELRLPLLGRKFFSPVR